MGKIRCTCEACGKEFYRYKYEILKHTFCSRECSRGYLSRKMTAMNQDLNPSRMREETKEKISRKHKEIKSRSSDSYEKTHGRHTHRVIVEQILGRPLAPGEVVHHIDGNKQNNNPDNLMVLQNQALHAALHGMKEVSR